MISLISWLSGVAVEGTIASERIWPTTSHWSNTSGNAVNVFFANQDAIRLVSPALVSDSWTMIGIRLIAAAIINGSATKPPLQKITSGWERRKNPKADTIPQTNKNTSLMFFNHDRMRVSRRNFPAILWTNDARIWWSWVCWKTSCSNPWRDPYR